MTDNNAVVAATSTKIEIFNNPSFGNIRTFVDVKGEPWFCGKDVASSLGYVDATKALSQHCRQDGVAKHPLIDSLGREQDTTFINEGNLYRLIMRSKLPSAEKFESWVVDEVLPTLRKTGSYSITKSPIERILANSVDQLEAVEAIKEVLLVEKQKQALIEARADKAEDEVKTLVHDDENTYTATDLAKDLGFRSAIAFNQWLKDIGFQYKQGKHWVVKAKYAEEGLVNIKLKDTGNGFNVKTMQFTNKGKLWITEKYRETHPKVLEIEYM